MTNKLSISNGSQTIPIDKMIEWLVAQKEKGLNLINIELEYGYHDSIDAINIQAKKASKEEIEFLSDRFTECNGEMV